MAGLVSRGSRYKLPNTSPMLARTRNRGRVNARSSPHPEGSIDITFCGENFPVEKNLNYKLNVQKSLKRKYEATLREFHVCAWETDGGLRIAFTPPAYELFRQAFSDYFAQRKDARVLHNICHKKGKEGAVQQTTIKVAYPDSTGVTVNFYHTTSSILVNGAALDTFVDSDMPEIRKQLDTLCTNDSLNAFNDNMQRLLREALDQMQGASERLRQTVPDKEDVAQSSVYQPLPISGTVPHERSNVPGSVLSRAEESTTKTTRAAPKTTTTTRLKIIQPGSVPSTTAQPATSQSENNRLNIRSTVAAGGQNEVDNYCGVCHESTDDGTNNHECVECKAIIHSACTEPTTQDIDFKCLQCQMKGNNMQAPPVRQQPAPALQTEAKDLRKQILIN
jgi:hypothetical protein